MSVRDFGLIGIGLNIANCADSLGSHCAGGVAFWGALVVVAASCVFRAGR